MSTVLVTGGTTRLGKIIADTLSAAGYRVIRSSHRTGAPADVYADLATQTGADDLYDETCNLLGCAPDAIVNNAALFSGSDEDLLSINVHAPRRLSERLARDAQNAAIVNILDCRVLSRRPHDLYSDTKAYLRDVTLQHARAFVGRVRVNAVAPGPVLTPTTVREKAGATPFGRPTAQAVADAVLFLLSAPFTTGCILPVDGGQSL